MKMKSIRKRILSFALAVLLMAALVPAQTFAASKYCSFASCSKTQKHTHSVCGKTSCKKSSKHSHNGKQYYGHSKNDGHAYHKCGASKCTRKSSHSHKNHSSSSHHSGNHH